MKQLCSLLLAVLLTGSALATQVSDLNTVDVHVADRSTDAFNQALPQAFNQALIKISGNPGVTTLPQVENYLSQVRQMVQSYSYNSVQNSAGGTQLELAIVFDQSRLMQILQQANQPIWQADRPQLLTWINVVDNQTGIISDGAQGEFKAALIAAAQRRGVPVIFPEMDLYDQAFVNDSPSTINDQSVQALVKHYDANGLLMATISPDLDQQWQASWLLWVNGAPLHWSDDATSVDAVIAKGVDQAANQMATQLAVLNDTRIAHSLLVEIDGIDSLTTYAKLTKLLAKQAQVKRVSTEQIDEHQVLLQIQTDATADQLLQSLQTVPGLSVQASPSTNTNAKPADIYLQWSAPDANPANTQS